MGILVTQRRSIRNNDRISGLPTGLAGGTIRSVERFRARAGYCDAAVRRPKMVTMLWRFCMIWTARRLSLAAAAGLFIGAFAMPAFAQWAWRDGSGRTVYSDQPPPSNITSDQIMRQPGPGSQPRSTVDNTNSPAA